MLANLVFLAKFTGVVLQIILIANVLGNDESDKAKQFRKDVSIAGIVLVVAGAVLGVALNSEGLIDLLGPIVQIVLLILLTVNAHEDDGSEKYKKNRKTYATILLVVHAVPFALLVIAAIGGVPLMIKKMKGVENLPRMQ